MQLTQWAFILALICVIREQNQALDQGTKLYKVGERSIADLEGVVGGAKVSHL